MLLSETLLQTLPPLLPEQEDLQPPVPTVLGSIEYRRWRQRLERINEILRPSGMEETFVRLCLKRRLAELETKAQADGQPPAALCPGEQVLFPRTCAEALRTTIAGTLIGGSYRHFARRLAESSLLQWFCRLGRLDVIRVPGKSQLQRYQEMVDESELRQVVDGLLETAAEPASPLELAEPVDLETQFLDSTCGPLNIHYPVDWVLLRDAGRTLLKATLLIRKRGRKGRMKEPREFLKRMNRLAMEMTKQARRAGSRQGRKKTLRAMKRQVKIVAAHARRPRDLLEARWAETDLSQREAQQILHWIDTILERLPLVVRQAYERIIGGRPVANEEKILSLQEGHAAVYVRGKAGAEVEFGSQWLLAEAACGLVTDWELGCGNPEHDTVLLRRSLERDAGRRVKTVVGDRNFDSQGTRAWRRERQVSEAITPRDPAVLRARLREAEFQRLQQRRGQTEARIAILQNGFLGAPLLAKGHENQARQVAWAVLTHNLWLLAGLPTKRKQLVFTHSPSHNRLDYPKCFRWAAGSVPRNPLKRRCGSGAKLPMSPIPPS